MRRALSIGLHAHSLFHPVLTRPRRSSTDHDMGISRMPYTSPLLEESRTILKKVCIGADASLPAPPATSFDFLLLTTSTEGLFDVICWRVANAKHRY
jgi:hypothetical protein